LAFDPAVGIAPFDETVADSISAHQTRSVAAEEADYSIESKADRAGGSASSCARRSSARNFSIAPTAIDGGAKGEPAAESEKADVTDDGNGVDSAKFAGSRRPGCRRIS
jgi:hypothetical protein